MALSGGSRRCSTMSAIEGKLDGRWTSSNAPVNRHARSPSPKSPRFPQRLYLYRRRCRDLYDVDPDELLQSLQ
jgi:hypothetical protein